MITENKMKIFNKTERRVVFVINAIVFDVDDTLYDQQEPFRNAVKKVIPAIAEKDLHPLYLRFRYHSDESFEKVATKKWSLIDFRIHRICESLKDLGYLPLTKEAAINFQLMYENELNCITLPLEVKKTLDHLAEQDVTLAIITNGPTEHQLKKIEQLQLEQWISPDKIIVSQATGYQKPDVEIFNLAEELFDLTPENTLYIGDNFDNDVLGSKKANWQSIWFNHRQRSLPKNACFSHDAEITSFEELFAGVTNFINEKIPAGTY